MGIKCFFLEPTELYDFSLRRYTPNSKSFTCEGGWHEASTPLGRHPVSFAPEVHEGHPVGGDLWPHDDVRWPTKCPKCQHTFKEEDVWQLFCDAVFKRHDNGEMMTLRDAPVGAMYFADWMGEYTRSKSIDGHVLAVKLPDGHYWYTEQRASNCDSPCKNCGVRYMGHEDKTRWDSNTNTSILEVAADPRSCSKVDALAGIEWKDRRRYEDSKPHLCWVRHGTPPHEVVHVDKNGVTCGAGAGSIALPSWHGFLHNGELVG